MAFFCALRFLVKGYLRCTAFYCENLLESIYFVWSAICLSLDRKKWGKHGQLNNIPDKVLMRVLSPNEEVFMTLLLKYVSGGGTGWKLCLQKEKSMMEQVK